MSQLVGGEHESWLSTLMDSRCVSTPNTALRNFREQGIAREAHLTMMRLRQGGCCTKLPPESEAATVESSSERSISSIYTSTRQGESHAVSISAGNTEADIRRDDMTSLFFKTVA
ncbi:hypothetical protein G5I_04470 [Acromyrmex echinatior]|uniref:Uncharacterized protein n=1 Tax=Acromyrmex echinatior TaxID=103372 RepID=F4WFR1_ACREC|nr:hypothetical protein G5I_04470 [Acromyrmex echinatior]